MVGLGEESRKKGFMSRNNLVTVNEEYYILWMCELQTWLRKEHGISVEPYSYLSTVGVVFRVDIFKLTKKERVHIMYYKVNKLSPPPEFNDWFDALEEGLFEGLKLLK